MKISTHRFLFVFARISLTISWNLNMIIFFEISVRFSIWYHLHFFINLKFTLNYFTINTKNNRFFQTISMFFFINPSKMHYWLFSTNHYQPKSIGINLFRMHYVGIGPYKVLILNWNKRFLQAHARAGPHNSFGRIRPVTGWGEVVCTCWDIRSVNLFCFLKTSILQLEMVEHLKVRQECYRIENHYF